MHDKVITLLNFLSANDQTPNQLLPLENTSLESSDSSSQNQSVKVLGLAVVASSLGAIFTFPQVAQATLTNLSVANSHSSILISKSTPQKDQAIVENPQLATAQESLVPTSIIEIRSRIDSDPNSVTTVTIPQLPSLSVAQNISRKKITKHIYTVRAGDTINSIARLYGISAAKIIEANNIKNPNRLSINNRLIIPLEESEQVNLPNAKPNFLSSNTKFVSSSATSPMGGSSVNSTAQTINSDRNSRLSNSQEEVRDPYISKLRADIDRLRHQYQSQQNNDQSEVSVNRNRSTMYSERLESNYAPRAIPSLSQDDRNVTSATNSSSEDLLFSSAISPIDNYNQLLNSRIRETLKPQLPPLSEPEEYLPDNSNFFNGYMWPAQGTLTSGYGWRWGRMHKGIDIAAPIGTPIVAAGAGEVIFAGWNSGGYGNLVKVKHPDGSVTLYAHNNKIFVRQGQKVKQGQQIAEMGSTGYSTGPHLHFEIRTNGSTAINPIALLPKK